MSANQKGNWCIFYRKLSEPTVWHTMKTWRKDGVLVSAKTYDDVYKFGRFKEAFDFAKNLITGAEQFLSMTHRSREFVMREEMHFI